MVKKRRIGALRRWLIHRIVRPEEIFAYYEDRAWIKSGMSDIERKMFTLSEALELELIVRPVKSADIRLVTTEGSTPFINLVVSDRREDEENE